MATIGTTRPVELEGNTLALKPLHSSRQSSAMVFITVVYGEKILCITPTIPYLANPGRRQ